ncbi:MAG: hypothetical protein ACJ746_31095 [Bryobacteraceae bacterium]
MTPRVAKPEATRKVYPFSVIYGGAYSGEELARIRQLDAVVARHYVGFGSSATVQRIPKDAFMYVSYRKSNQVFWTKAKHRIPQGEAVLSDGKKIARTRCGNRLSFKPEAPVDAANEPTEEALNIPDRPKASLEAANPGPSGPEPDFYVPATPVDISSLLPPTGLNAPSLSQPGAPGFGTGGPYGFGSNPGGVGPYFGHSLFYPNAAGSSSGGTGPAAAIADYGPGTALSAPEPGTLTLLLIGGLLGSPTLLRKWRNRRDTRG